MVAGDPLAVGEGRMRGVSTTNPGMVLVTVDPVRCVVPCVGLC